MNETMALTRRNRNANSDVLQHITMEDSRGSKSKKLLTSVIKTVLVVTVLVGAVLFGAGNIRTRTPTKGKGTFVKQHWLSSELVYTESFANNVHLSMKFARPQGQKTNDFVSLGPHNVSLRIKGTCSNPRFWFRLVGDTLVYIPLSMEVGDNTAWTGSFYIPMEGSYITDARWFGCDGSKTFVLSDQPTEIIAKGAATQASSSMNSQKIFPESVWMASTKFHSKSRLPPYIWSNLNVTPESTTLVAAGDSTVSKEATPIDPAFSGLSNYELVCWVGSKSAELLRNAFLNLRKELFPAQRPFKFHMYPMNNFDKPDQLWDDGKKRSFRKCKHVLVSVDEMEHPITQDEYKSQVTKFLNDLVKCVKDPTFPIWIFTVNEPPMNATTCTAPTRHSTTDHPCNTALKDLFATSPFPSHVRLLDNTDVSLPQFDENQVDVMAVIAMRIYSIVGTQVAKWRAAGQRGAIDGLHRGDKIELNEDLLIPYTWQ